MKKNISSKLTPSWLSASTALAAVSTTTSQGALVQITLSGNNLTLSSNNLNADLTGDGISLRRKRKAS